HGDVHPHRREAVGGGDRGRNRRGQRGQRRHPHPEPHGLIPSLDGCRNIVDGVAGRYLKPSRSRYPEVRSFWRSWGLGRSGCGSEAGSPGGEPRTPPTPTPAPPLSAGDEPLHAVAITWAGVGREGGWSLGGDFQSNASAMLFAYRS